MSYEQAPPAYQIKEPLTVERIKILELLLANLHLEVGGDWESYRVEVASAEMPEDSMLIQTRHATTIRLSPSTANEYPMGKLIALVYAYFVSSYTATIFEEIPSVPESAKLCRDLGVNPYELQHPKPMNHKDASMYQLQDAQGKSYAGTNTGYHVQGATMMYPRGMPQLSGELRWVQVGTTGRGKGTIASNTPDLTSIKGMEL